MVLNNYEIYAANKQVSTKACSEKSSYVSILII